MTDMDAWPVPADEVERRVRMALAEIGKPWAFTRVAPSTRRPGHFSYFTLHGALSMEERWLLWLTVWQARVATLCFACYCKWADVPVDDRIRASVFGCWATAMFVRDCGRTDQGEQGRR